MEKMHANVFHGKGDASVEEAEHPRAVAGGAVTRVTPTTMRGADLHAGRRRALRKSEESRTAILS